MGVEKSELAVGTGARRLLQASLAADDLAFRMEEGRAAHNIAHNPLQTLTTLQR